MVVVAVGLFAVGETLYVASRYRFGQDEIIPLRGSIWMTREEWRRSWKPWLRGTAFGFPIGAMPAGGAEIPTFLSYYIEKKLSSKPEEFGKGAIEGVAGPEAANNASAAGVLVPMLTLGLPTSATAAIMLSAFQSYGINPGPLLLQSQPQLVWGLIASLFIGNVMLLVLNLPMIAVWVKLLQIPAPLLYAGILVFATIGTYGITQSPVDLILLYLVGGIGYLMRRYDFPAAPVIIGMILGPLAEQNFRQAMTISAGDWTVLFTRPLSASILALAAARAARSQTVCAYLEQEETRAVRPLAGLLVLDFSTLLPGPMATLLLAEAGAEVVKVERPGSGEEMRGYRPKWGTDSANFALLNRGKKSIALDLKNTADRARLQPLVERADVIVEQFRPGVMARLALDYDAVAKVNPTIVYCSISGYGQTVPSAMWRRTISITSAMPGCSPCRWAISRGRSFRRR